MHALLLSLLVAVAGFVQPWLGTAMIVAVVLAQASTFHLIANRGDKLSRLGEKWFLELFFGWPICLVIVGFGVALELQSLPLYTPVRLHTLNDTELALLAIAVVSTVYLAIVRMAADYLAGFVPDESMRVEKSSENEKFYLGLVSRR